MNKISCDVLVVGGGLVGGPLAKALAVHGLTVAVVDRADPRAAVPDGRSSAVALAPKRMLDAVGLWDGLAEFAEPILEIRVSDGSSPHFLHYDHDEVGDEPLGYIAENHLLLNSLGRALADTAGVTLMAPATLVSVERDEAGVTASLDDGTRIEARLLVAADGRASEIRRAAGIGVARKNYGQAAIVCTVTHQYPHHGIAQERFLPAGPFAVLPLPGRRSSIVWTERAHLAPAIVAAGDAQFQAELEHRFGDFLGAVAVEGGRFSYPLSAQYAKAAHATRLVLVGDALHGMHPVAGQGMNMGLRDAAALTQVVVEAKRLGQDIGGQAVRQRYARWRRFDNLLMLGLTDGLVRLFSNDIRPLAHVRALGLATVNKLPPAKRFFMRHAMGVVGELPRLLTGKTV